MNTFSAYSLLFLFLAIFVLRTDAQIDDTIKNILENYDYPAMIDVFHKKYKYNEKIKSYYTYKLIFESNRELIDGYTERVIYVNKCLYLYDEIQEFDEKAGTINCILKDDKIVYLVGYIRDLNDIKSSEEVIERFDPQSFVVLQAAWLTAYGDPLRIDKLFGTDLYFGYRCGIAGQASGTEIFVRKLVEQQDTAGLVTLLKSPQVEYQLYAIDAILALTKNGIKFDDKVYKIIDIVSLRKGMVHTCIGCLAADKSIAEIINEIKKRHSYPKKQ